MKHLCLTILFGCIIAIGTASAQKIGYVSTDAIRKAYESNKQAEERLNALVEEWKTELAQRQRDIDEFELEIRKNRSSSQGASTTNRPKSSSQRSGTRSMLRFKK
jgi:Skp family chaperone for outer membrane proteins